MAGTLEADIAAAAEEFPAVRGVYVLQSPEHPDAHDFAIVLQPFDQRTLVEVHYAVLSATDTRTGSILYVNGDLSSQPVPMRRARLLSLAPAERAFAIARISRCRAARRPEVVEVAPDPFAPANPAFEALMRETFEQLRDRTTSADPYRAGVSIDMRTGVIAVVADPFPTGPRPRILVIDEDTDTASTLRRCQDFEVTHIDEGWAAVEAVEKTEYDAILCALRVGAMSGASLHRMIAKTRPELASRIAFVAAPHLVASAPPSSALGRVLARPVTVEHVRALLA